MAQMADYLTVEQFDGWLESELGKGFVPFSLKPAPAGAPYSATLLRPKATALRTLVLVAAVSIGLVITSAIAAGAATGSANPVVWSQYVSDAVTTCKNQLGNGQHGIGKCVSAFAHQKEAQNGAQKSNGHGKGNKHVPAGTP
jgi:hypothetical protein